MPLLVSRDSYDARQVTLSGLVALCSDCKKYCLEKTERLVTNSSRPPRGWEKEYAEIAEKRRQEDMTSCVDACQLLPRSCPSVERLQMLEGGIETAGKRLGAASGGSSAKSGWFRNTTVATKKEEELVAPTTQEVSRCEHAAERFSKVLFAIVQKPTKVHFDNINPKTGEKMSTDIPSEGEVGAADVSTDVNSALASGKKKLDKQTIHDEILRRWSTSRRERTNMEDLGVIRTGEETQQLKEELIRQRQSEEKAKVLAEAGRAGQSGTLPKW